MPIDTIDYQSSGYFSKIIIDYLNNDDSLKAFHNHFPNIENFRIQIEEKNRNFSHAKRQVVVDAIRRQYKDLDDFGNTNKQIDLLSKKTTFTITTGHQLNIFTGPIYFLYKIVSTINLCKKLKFEFPTFDFVPIYWMASEDHDFEEINFFNFCGKKIKWDIKTKGAVGRLSTGGLENVFEAFSKELGVGNHADFLKGMFKSAYLEHRTLASATRYLVNQLFGKSGIVIVDGDDVVLKKQFIPIIKDELTSRKSFVLVNETIEKLHGYKIQVNPREINLFYLNDGLRERIVAENNIYKINNTNLFFSETKILEILETNPERFSPNVVLRPLYQETILPNLCYIGGGGEIAYWLELKAVFEYYETTFPILLLRNSAIVVSSKQLQKIEKLNLTLKQLFLKQNDLLASKTNELSEIEVDFVHQKQFLKVQFKDMYQIALQTDKSFMGAVLAQEKKQLNGLDNLEKRFLRAQKRKYETILRQIVELQDELFPNQGLQERRSNFAEFYDESFINQLLEKLDPLNFNFSVIKIG